MGRFKTMSLTFPNSQAKRPEQSHYQRVVASPDKISTHNANLFRHRDNKPKTVSVRQRARNITRTLPDGYHNRQSSGVSPWKSFSNRLVPFSSSVARRMTTSRPSPKDMKRMHMLLDPNHNESQTLKDEAQPSVNDKQSD